MTNLLIGYADIPYASTGVTATPSAATGYPVSNLFGGNRTEIFRTNDNATNGMLVFVPLSASKSANFLFVGNVNLLNGENITTATLYRNSVNNFGTAVSALAITLSSETLYGPESTDIIRSFAATTAYQYWWFVLNKVGTMQSPFSKLFFGTSFDMGRDPLTQDFEISRFHEHPSQRRELYRINMTWDSVPKATTISFYSSFVLERRYRPVILYTTTYHALLDDHRVLYGRFTDVTIPPKVTDYNTITATFEEVA